MLPKKLRNDLEYYKRDIAIILISFLLALNIIGWFFAPSIGMITEELENLPEENHKDLNLTEKIELGIVGYNLSLVSINLHMLWALFGAMIITVYYLLFFMYHIFSKNTDEKRLEIIEKKLKIYKCKT